MNLLIILSSVFHLDEFFIGLAFALVAGLINVLYIRAGIKRKMKIFDNSCKDSFLWLNLATSSQEDETEDDYEDEDEDENDYN